MRQYAYLKEPLQQDDGSCVYKIMLYETKEGIYLFEYGSPDAEQCSADRCYGSLADLYADWDALLDARGWIAIEDPLPGCQHDAFLPLRVKGRGSGTPEWGTFETLRNGEWVAYQPEA